jgi:hypothetical protein
MEKRRGALHDRERWNSRHVLHIRRPDCSPLTVPGLGLIIDGFAAFVVFGQRIAG